MSYKTNSQNQTIQTKYRTRRLWKLLNRRVFFLGKGSKIFKPELAKLLINDKMFRIILFLNIDS